MPYEIQVHGQDVEDAKLAKAIIAKAPESVELNFKALHLGETGFSGDLRRAPSGLYTIFGPPSARGSWHFQLCIKNGNSGNAKFITA